MAERTRRCSGKQSACSAYRSDRVSSAVPSVAGSALAVTGGIAASSHACSISARHVPYSHTCSHMMHGTPPATRGQSAAMVQSGWYTGHHASSSSYMDEHVRW